MWDRALATAQSDSKLYESVKRQRVQSLKSGGHVDQLAKLDLSAALDLLAQRGEWQ